MTRLSISAFRHWASWTCMAAVVLALAACQKSDEFVYTDEDTSEGTSVDVVVADDEGNKTSLPSGTAMGIYVTDTEGGVTCQQMVVDGNGQIVIPLTTGYASVVAYCPFQPEWGTDAMTNHPVFEVQVDQSDDNGYKASDLMMGTMATDTRSTVGMVMKHMLVKVAVHVVDETGQVDFTRLGARLVNVNNSVLVDLEHVSVETLAENRSDVRMNVEVRTDWRMSAYAIVAPQTVQEGRTLFTVTMGGSKQRYLVPQTTEMEGGKTYTFNVRLTDDGLIPDGNYVTDWDEENENDLI